MSQAPGPTERTNQSTESSDFNVSAEDNAPAKPQTFPGEAPPPATRQADQQYRALSVLALIGFLIGMAYVVIVGLLFLVGVLSGSPSIMPGWTIIIPIIAITICIVARYQISSSEGTLAGEALARWSIILCLFIGVGYWSYRTALYFAVRQQAASYAEEWIKLIRENQLNRAAYRMLPPLDRLKLDDDEKELGKHIRMFLGRSPRPDDPDPLDKFRNSSHVKLLQTGGELKELKLLGTKEFQHTKKGFEVTLHYRVKTELFDFDLFVDVLGSHAPRGQYSGRRWVIPLSPKTGINSVSETAKGKQLHKILEGSDKTLENWREKVASSDSFIDSYLYTLSPEDREKARKALSNRWSLAAVGSASSLMALEKDLKLEKSLLTGYEDYLNAKMWDMSAMAGGNKSIQSALGQLKTYFATEGRDGALVTSPQPSQGLPDWGMKDGIMTTTRSIMLFLPPSTGGVGRVTLKAKVPEITEGTEPPEWWIDKIQLQVNKAPTGPPDPAVIKD